MSACEKLAFLLEKKWLCRRRIWLVPCTFICNDQLITTLKLPQLTNVTMHRYQERLFLTSKKLCFQYSGRLHEYHANKIIECPETRSKPWSSRSLQWWKAVEKLQAFSKGKVYIPSRFLKGFDIYFYLSIKTVIITLLSFNQSSLHFSDILRLVKA